MGLLYSQKFYSITIIYLILTLQILFRYWLNDTTFSSSTINEKKFYTDFELKLFWPISVKAAISIYYFIQGDYDYDYSKLIYVTLPLISSIIYPLYLYVLKLKSA